MRVTKKKLIICGTITAIVFLLYQFSSMQLLLSKDVNTKDRRFKYQHVVKLANKQHYDENNNHSKQLTGEKFTCLSGNIVIPMSYFNDDYCDCPDGSDEPRTSACNDAFFKCSSSHVIGNDKLNTIPNSRINDGICDCCDGSDEYLPPSSYFHTIQLIYKKHSKVPITPCHIVC